MPRVQVTADEIPKILEPCTKGLLNEMGITAETFTVVNFKEFLNNFKELVPQVIAKSQPKQPQVFSIPKIDYNPSRIRSINIEETATEPVTLKDCIEKGTRPVSATKLAQTSTLYHCNLYKYFAKSCNNYVKDRFFRDIFGGDM
ncbi:MAG: hypothetical protein LBH74_02450 [Nitrososphaerota archaeon]|jgi:hypothetical protein|nr:hypothetical protein [Nitrososphaerota archaeon]